MRGSAFFLGFMLAATGAAVQAQGTWQALPDKAPEPADNPTTAAKVELGKMLYFEPVDEKRGSK